MELFGYDNLKPRTTLEWHIANTYRDAEFQDATRKVVTNSDVDRSAAIQMLAEKYLLEEREVEYFIKYFDDKEMKLPRSRRVWISRLDQLVEITFTASASRVEVIEVLDIYFQSRPGRILLREPVQQPTKRKPPENPSLIYAIFRQSHIHDIKFDEIFRQYSNGSLEGYRGQNSQYPTMSKLLEYYNHFKPIPPEV